jgi:hypothetical protein
MANERSMCNGRTYEHESGECDCKKFRRIIFYMPSLSYPPLVVEVRLGACVREVKQQIFEAKTIPVRMQCILYNGSPLEDDAILPSKEYAFNLLINP